MTDLKKLLLKCEEVLDKNWNPYTGKGLGGKDFSWTVALVIDMLHHSQEKKN